MFNFRNNKFTELIVSHTEFLRLCMIDKRRFDTAEMEFSPGNFNDYYNGLHRCSVNLV